jgi:hypothetical protein
MDLLSPRLFRIAHVAGIALIAAPFGCVPETDVDESKLDAPRVLAVRAEPAEAREGERVTYTALLANAAGRLDKGVLAWFQCGARLPLSELAPISSVCLDPTSEENHRAAALLQMNRTTLVEKLKKKGFVQGDGHDDG